MCGRYTLRKGLSNIAEKIGNYALSHEGNSENDAEPRFNIAPTQQSLVLRKPFDDAKGILAPSRLRWGLIPSWSKNPQSQTPMINARSETVAEKPSFRAAFQRRRCLVPADGFYEWKKQKGANQPFFFSLKDDSVFLMAGIWESWIGEHEDTIESFTILTTHANPLLSRYHERMPVILNKEQIPVWLESDFSKAGPSEIASLLRPLEAELMQVNPANPIVNNNRSEGPECLVAPSSAPISQLDLGL